VTSEFLTGEVSSLSNDKKGSGVKIPLLGKVAAGLPIEAAENVIGEEEIPRRLAESATYFALLIKGDSMSPYICDGDKVIVRQQSEVENGQIAIVLVNGSDAVCKEFKKTPSGVMLISKNPNYDPMVFTHDEVDTTPVRIVGRVVEIRREL
jgi:repressor LexA